MNQQVTSKTQIAVSLGLSGVLYYGQATDLTENGEYVLNDDGKPGIAFAYRIEVAKDENGALDIDNSVLLICSSEVEGEDVPSTIEQMNESMRTRMIEKPEGFVIAIELNRIVKDEGREEFVKQSTLHELEDGTVIATIAAEMNFDSFVAQSIVPQLLPDEYELTAIKVNEDDDIWYFAPKQMVMIKMLTGGDLGALSSMMAGAANDDE